MYFEEQEIHLQFEDSGEPFHGRKCRLDREARRGAYFIFDIILSQRLNRCMACIEHDAPPLKSEIQQLGDCEACGI